MPGFFSDVYMHVAYLVSVSIHRKTTILSCAGIWAAIVLQCDNYNLKSHRRCSNMSRMNLSGYVGQVAIFSWTCCYCCCIVVGLGLGLDLLSG